MFKDQINEGSFDTTAQAEIPKKGFKFLKGEIYMVNFSVGDGESVYYGKRPCLIVSNTYTNQHSPVINCVPLTSKIDKRHYRTHIKLKPDSFNKLRVESIVMCEQVKTINKEVIQFKIGCLSELDMERLNRALRYTFDLK